MLTYSLDRPILDVFDVLNKQNYSSEHCIYITLKNKLVNWNRCVYNQHIYYHCVKLIITNRFGNELGYTDSTMVIQPKQCQNQVKTPSKQSNKRIRKVYLVPDTVRSVENTV